MRLLRALAAIALAPLALRAQTIHGTVTATGDAPIAGVVVTMVDAQGRAIARALTNARGEFRVAAPNAGTYRLRTLRIGYRPVESEPIALGAGDDVARTLAVATVAFALDTVRVTDRASCRMSDAAAATFAVWEQAREAIAATQLTAAGRTIRATVVSSDRTLTPDLHDKAPASLALLSGYVTQPWRSLAPDSLHRHGYVIEDATGATTYHAPGLDALLAPSFIEDHCFKLKKNRNPSLLGLSFEPTSDRRKLNDIEGTLWLDRKTSELQRLEYRYTSLPAERQELAGGEMQFARTSAGSWLIARWSIRMPAMALFPKLNGQLEPRVAEVHVTGGDLALATQDRDTLYAGARVALTGTVIDSATGRASGGARVALGGTARQAVTDDDGRFRFADVLPGVYPIEVHTPGLDSLGAAYRSTVSVTDGATPLRIRVPRPPSRMTLATLSGFVLADSTQTPIAGAEVAFPALDRRVTTDANGAFRLTDLPSGAQQLTVRRIGFGPLDTRVDLAPNRTTERTIYLPRVNVVEKVVVEDKRSYSFEFEERRKLGFGIFFDSLAMRRNEFHHLPDMLRTMPGIVTVSPPGCRNPDTICGYMNKIVAAKRVVVGDPCVMSVYVNGVLLGPGGRLSQTHHQWGKAFDLGSILVSGIEAMEVYRRASEIPARFADPGGAECGAVVIWLRGTR